MDTPDYSFHFAKPDKSVAELDLDPYFFFDNGKDFTKEFTPTLVALDDGNLVDFGDRRPHYFRLFPLRSVPGKERYYLVPWLSVPFEDLGSGFAATATRDKDRTKPAIIPLVVKPFSIFESTIDANAKRAIKAAAAMGPTPQLTLYSPHAAVSANWSDTSAPAIDEKDCIKTQRIVIRVQPHGARYPDQLFVDIKRGSATVGRICLLFHEAITHKVVILQASRISKQMLELQMLDPASSPTAAPYLGHVQEFFPRLGIDYSPATPFFSWDVGGNTVECDLTTPLAIPSVGGSFENPVHLPERILDSIYDAFIHHLDAEDLAQYTFVCLSPWALDPVAGSRTSGISRVGQHLSCVFNQLRETTVHEICHALALPHYFSEGLAAAVALPKPADRQAAIQATFARRREAGRNATLAMGITTRRRFYEICDLMNGGNACSVFDELMPVPVPMPEVPSTRTPSQRFFFYFNLDFYPLRTTANLMDYRPGPPDGTSKEDLVKGQIDTLRYMIASSLTGITVSPVI